jgi:ATP-dependent DNA helicase RecQ
MGSYRSLEARVSHRLAQAVARATDSFPKAERLELTSQLRCASLSTPANLAQGCAPFERRDLHRPSPSPTLTDARSALRRFWNYDRFHAHQRRAIAAALRGRDCLAILPTGGGKSLCYQVPALLLPGVTLVVSPLISLMQDQVAALRRRGLPAAYLSSTQAPHVQRAVWRLLGNHRLKLLYVAPERMRQLVSVASTMRISLLAVDEAHCISEWGHDFRPHFRALGGHRHALGTPPTLAVTATATPATRADIVRVLGLERPVCIVQSFDRANLHFSVRKVSTELERLHALTRLLPSEDAGSAVVYVPTRNRTDGVTAVLRRWGFAAAPYHAGLRGGARKALLTRFLDDRIRIIVATSAFGMGIDKPDVRLVVHLGVPTRPETYFQEAGRAGRDGKPAGCVLLWLPQDLALAERMARRAPSAAAGESAAHREARQKGLRAMRRYLTTGRCRRRVLLDYLGEQLGRCAGCDRC